MSGIPEYGTGQHEDYQRQQDERAELARDQRAEEVKREFDGWFEAQGLDDQGRFDQDEMQFAFEGGMQAQRDLDATQQPQAPRSDAGTIKHGPTGATWVTWDHGKQPPWEPIAEAVARLTGGAVKIRPANDEEEPDRLAVAVYRDLPELEDV